MATDFVTLKNELEALKNDFQAISYRIQESLKEIENNLNGIAPYVNGSQNGSQALVLMQAAYDELNKVLEYANDAIDRCDQDIGKVNAH